MKWRAVEATLAATLVLVGTGCGSVSRGYAALEDGDLERAGELARRAEQREEPGEALLRAEVGLARDDADAARAALDDVPAGRDRLLAELRLAESSSDTGAWNDAWTEAFESGIAVPTPGAAWAAEVIRPLLLANVNAAAALIEALRADGGYSDEVRETAEATVDVLLYRLLAGGGALEARATLRVLEPAMSGAFVIEKHRAAQTMTRSPERTDEVFAPLASSEDAGIAFAVEFAQRGAHAAAVAAWQWLIDRSDAPPSGWFRRAAESSYALRDRERARAFADAAFAAAEDWDDFLLVDNALVDAGDVDWLAPAVAGLAERECDGTLSMDVQELRTAAALVVINETALTDQDAAAVMAQERIDAGCAPLLMAEQMGGFLLELDRPVLARAFLEQALTMEPTSWDLVQPYLESVRTGGGTDGGEALATLVVEAFEAEPHLLDGMGARGLAETLEYHDFVRDKPTLDPLVDRVFAARLAHEPADWETTTAMVVRFHEAGNADAALAQLHTYREALSAPSDGWVQVGDWLETNMWVGRELFGPWYQACGESTADLDYLLATDDTPVSRYGMGRTHLHTYCWFRAAERYAVQGEVSALLEVLEQYKAAEPNPSRRWARLFGSDFIMRRLPADTIAELANTAERDGYFTGNVALHAGRAAVLRGASADGVDYLVRAVELDPSLLENALAAVDGPQMGGELIALLARLGEGHGDELALTRANAFARLAQRSDRRRREDYLALADAAYREFLAEGGSLTALVPDQLFEARLYALSADAYAAALEQEPGNLRYLLGHALALAASPATDAAVEEAVERWIAAMEAPRESEDDVPTAAIRALTGGLMRHRRPPELRVRVFQWSLDRAKDALSAENDARSLVQAYLEVNDTARARQIVHTYFVAPARQVRTPFSVRPPLYREGDRAWIAEALFLSATTLYGEMGAWALAEEAAREALALDPENRSLLPVLIQLATLTRGGAPSFDTIAAIVAEAGGEPAAWALAAESLSMALPEYSLRAWDRAIALSPEDATLQTGRIRTLVLLGRVDEAFERTMTDVAEVPEEVWTERSRYFREIDRPDLSDALAAARPGGRTVVLERALYQETHGDPARAQRMFEDSAIPQAEYIAYLLRSGRYSEGLTAWTRATSRIPSDDARSLYTRFGDVAAARLPRMDALTLAEAAFEQRWGTSFDGELTLGLQFGRTGRLTEAVALLHPLVDRLRRGDQLSVAAMEEALGAGALRDEALEAMRAGVNSVSEFDDDFLALSVRWHLAGAGLTGDRLDALVASFASGHPDPVFGRLAVTDTLLLDEPAAALHTLLAFHDERLRSMRRDLVASDVEDRMLATLDRFLVAGFSEEVAEVASDLATTRAFPSYLLVAARAWGDSPRGGEAWATLEALSASTSELRADVCLAAPVVGQSAAACFEGSDRVSDTIGHAILRAAIETSSAEEREALVQLADETVTRNGAVATRAAYVRAARAAYRYDLAAAWDNRQPAWWDTDMILARFGDLYYGERLDEAEAFIREALVMSLYTYELASGAGAMVHPLVDPELAAFLESAAAAAYPLAHGDGARSCAAGIVQERAIGALNDGKARAVIAVSEARCGPFNRPMLAVVAATEEALFDGGTPDFPTDASSGQLRWAANELLRAPPGRDARPDLAEQLATSALRSPDAQVSAYAIRARARARAGDLEGASADAREWTSQTMALLELGPALLTDLAAAGARAAAFDLADRITDVPVIREEARGLEAAMRAFREGDPALGLAWLAERRPDILENPGASGAELTLATLYQAVGDVTSAIATLRSARIRHPDLPVLLNNLAYALSNSDGDMIEAEALARRSLALDDDPAPSTLDTLAWVLYQRGEYEAAEHWITLALRLWPAYGSHPDGDTELREHLTAIRAALTEADDTAAPLPNRRRGRRRR